MRPVRTGVQRTSRPSPRTRVTAIVVAIALSLPTILAPAPVAAATDYLLMSRSALLARPTSGTAWSNLRAAAGGSLGSPNLCDQNRDHHLRTLAAALVYARTGTSSFGTKARSGVMSAIGTQRVGCGNASLALGRQLTAYVLAADFAGLSGASNSTFRAWLSTIRTKIIGGHSIWDSLRHTHLRSNNNWGAYAGAARIAASLYLGDRTDVAAAARVTRGFLGDRSAYAGFTATLSSASLSWTCSGSRSSYTPVNRWCTRGGVNVDGAVVADISRGGSRRWPPGNDGVSYQMETIQGLGLQVELLFQNGYSSAWRWSSSALKRMAGVVTRSRSSGGTGWNATRASRQMPWLLNRRYGLRLPTASSGIGRAIGFTDWLWGPGGGSGGGGGPAGPPAGARPVVRAPAVRLSMRSSVPSSGVPVLVSWSLKSTTHGLRRFQVQTKAGSGSFVTRALSSPRATSLRISLPARATSVVRVRAVDLDGRVGPWVQSVPTRPSSISDGSSAIDWSGSWKKVSSSGYLGGYNHSTNANGATATLSFSGRSIAWVGPVGPTRGSARVFLDGSPVATIRLHRSSFQPRRIVWAANVGDGGHTLVIRGLGTSGHPTVAVDHLYVLNPS